MSALSYDQINQYVAMVKASEAFTYYGGLDRSEMKLPWELSRLVRAIPWTDEDRRSLGSEYLGVAVAIALERADDNKDEAIFKHLLYNRENKFQSQLLVRHIQYSSQFYGWNLQHLIL